MLIAGCRGVAAGVVVVVGVVVAPPPFATRSADTRLPKDAKVPPEVPVVGPNTVGERSGKAPVGIAAVGDMFAVHPVAPALLLDDALR